jgi:hypothetical protein
MDASALWADSDEVEQCKFGPTPLATGVQTTPWEGLLTEMAPVGVRNKLNEFSSFRKGTSSIATV